VCPGLKHSQLVPRRTVLLELQFVRISTRVFFIYGIHFPASCNGYHFLLHLGGEMLTHKIHKVPISPFASL
jgi:hypothetical protein